jgi:hypothetical protein
MYFVFQVVLNVVFIMVEVAHSVGPVHAEEIVALS